MTRQELFAWAADQYGTQPEYLWDSAPNYAVFRASSGKWYGILMDVPKNRLGMAGEEPVDVLNVKCGPALVGALRQQEGYLPAYHMNKSSWVSIPLGRVPDEDIKALLDVSYHAAMPKRRPKKEGPHD